MAGYKGIPHKTNLKGKNFSALKRQVICVDTGVTAIEFLDSSDAVDLSYDVLEFHVYNFNPATDAKGLQFQVKTSSYNYVTPITSTIWESHATYSGSTKAVAYNTSDDQQQGTSYQHITGDVDNAASASAGGILKLYGAKDPAFHKHWMAELSSFVDGNKGHMCQTGGYLNTAEVITGIKFIAEGGGSFDATIALYGVA